MALLFRESYPNNTTICINKSKNNMPYNNGILQNMKA